MNIAVIGVGNMGRAVIGGIRRSCGDDMRIVGWDKIIDGADGVDFIDPREWARAGFAPDAVIVAVKPCDVAGVLDDFVVPVHKQGICFLTVSIAAGVTIASMRERFIRVNNSGINNDINNGGVSNNVINNNAVSKNVINNNAAGNGAHDAKICRVMPNTPAMIGEGVSAYAMSDNCTSDDARLVEKIFGACGKVMPVKENLMDAVTGLSGSGPAFVYSFIEALAEGGVAAGLPYETALEAAAQTVFGAAKMVLTAGEHPSVLRSRVTSPGGTTVAGLQALERDAFKNAIISAVTAAAARSAELSYYGR